ncbi:MAG TPA: hypothetical protein VFP00_05570 [Burkholderiales bacterium]|nr:hypothetical protein [Burkholderiales bacterium]
MPTIEDLGKRVKAKYPGTYDDLPDADVGRCVKQKFPGSYDDFTDLPQATGALKTSAGGGLRAPATGLAARVLPRSLVPRQEDLGPLAGGPSLTEGGLPAVGEIAGSLVPGPAKPLTAAAGAVAGLTAEKLIREGRLQTLHEAGTEAGLTLLPEAVESGGRAVGRAMLRNLPGGKLLRFEEAARQARQLPEYVFEPPERQAVGRVFETVRQSGLKVDVGNMRGYITALPTEKYDELLSEVKRIDRQLKTGGRYTQLVEALHSPQGATLAGYDIGDLQTLRSELRKRADQLAPVEAKQLLKDAQDAVDETIDQGIARGRVPRGQTPEILADARRQYARLRASEDMSTMIERSITSTPDLGMQGFTLRKFADALRTGRSEISQSVKRALDKTPGAAERLENALAFIAKNFTTIEFPLTDVSGFRRNFLVAGFGQMLSTIMLTDTGRSLFTQAVMQGRGRMSPNTVAAIFNMARREITGEPSAGQQLLTPAR